MAEPFDPYYTWLGIPPSEQPADHYRLLGIRQFEENREVISNAADQRMAHIRSFQTGPAAQHSQRVLNELSKAAGCLLNPRRKAMYDQHLRSASAHAATQQAMLPPTSAPAPTVHIETQSRRPPARPKPRSRGWLVGVVGATLALIVVAVIALVWRSQDAGGDGVPTATGPVTIHPDEPANAKIGTTSALPAASTDTKADPITPSAASTPATASQASSATEPAASAPSSVTKTTTQSNTVSSPSTIPNPATTAVANNSASSAPMPPTTSAPSSTSSPASATTPTATPSVEIPPGKPKALHFDGIDRIELSNSTGLLDLKAPFTVEMWVRFATDVSAHWLVGDLIIGPNHPEVSGGTVAGWQLIVQPGNAGAHRIGFSTRGGYASDTPATVNTWHHIAASSDTRRVTIHVDGRRAAAGNLELLLESFVPSPIPIHIGGHGHLHANQPPGFTGDLRDFRISSVCRYTANFEPAPKLTADADTQLLLDFLGSTGNQINDVSGHHRDGIVHGARWIPIDEPAAVAAVPAPMPPMPSPGTPATTTVPTISRQAIPDEVALVKAREQIKNVFETDLKQAKAAKELLALADKLLGLAADSNDDPAARFAMLEQAQQLASQAGDLSKSLSVIDELSNRFEVDVAKLKADAVSRCADSVKTTSDRRKLAESAILLLEDIISSGNIEAASEIAQVAVASAARAKDGDLGKIARDYRDDVAQIKKRLVEARTVESKLKDAPDDGDLNLEWGRFTCFHQRNWKSGLPALSKGGHEQLAAAAKRDMENPTDADQQVLVAQGWIDLAKELEVSERPAVLMRALHWFRLAEPQLKGLAKADVESRVKELCSHLPPRFQLAALKPQSKSPSFQPPPEFVGILGRIQVNGVDAGVMWKYESGLRMNQTNILSILAQANVPRGKLRFEFVGFVFAPESMTVNIAQQGGSATGTATLYVDNKPVGEVGGMRAASDVYKLELNAGEHTIRWLLQGDDLGASSLLFTNAATAQPLVLYHTQPLLAAVIETPTRARLNVNMNRN